MLKRKSDKEPQVLPGADQETDCQTAKSFEDPAPIAESAALDAPPLDEDAVEVDAHEHAVTWDLLAERGGVLDPMGWMQPRSRWAHALEKIALWTERPFNRIAGTNQLNPLYHTGTIATFLLLVVGLTGFYVFLFYQYGFDASYDAVAARLEGQPIGRIMRAVHKYASGALIITTLLHGYRTLFMERFRGPRWVAWVSGIVMTVIVWLAGVTGYWLIWDERAQLINQGFIRFLNSFSSLGTQLTILFTRAEATDFSWPILLILLAVHVLLFLAVAGFFFIHIMRLKRAQFLPDMHWTLGIGAVLIGVSLLFPVGMLPKGSFDWIPDAVSIDPLFLFFMPAQTTATRWLLWGGLLLLTAVSLALPWLPGKRKPKPAAKEIETAVADSDAPAKVAVAALDGPDMVNEPWFVTGMPTVNIIKDRCTGCTKCALDCPYGAIEMVERHDGKRHKYIAIEDPNLCVSCGICVGSCDGVAVTLGNTPPELLWETVSMQLTMAQATVPEGQVKVVFTCERHAAHGARPYLPNGDRQRDDVTVIALPCVGAAPPDLMTRALDAGAASVQVIGCPPGDCANREGNLWEERRLVRRRVPRLKRAYANAPVMAAWLAPDDFAQGLDIVPPLTTPEGADAPEPNYLASRRMFPRLSWRNFVGAFVLLALVMVTQVLVTDLPFRPAAAQQAQVQVLVTEPDLPFARTGAFARPAEAFELQLKVDGRSLATQTYAPDVLFAPEQTPFYSKQPIAPGDHQVQVVLVNEAADTAVFLYNKQVSLAPGQVLRINYRQDMQMPCRGDACLR